MDDQSLIRVLDNPLQVNTEASTEPQPVEKIPVEATVPSSDQFTDAGKMVIEDRIVQQDDEQPAYRRKIGVIEADIESNCKEHGVRGILKHENIMAMISEYSEDDKQARIYGKFQHLTGLVYKKFSRKIHVIRPFVPNPRDYCVIELLDPHPRNPDAVLWVAIDAKGRKFIVDELYLKFHGIDEMVMRIKSKADQYRIVQRRADPAAWVEDQHTRMTLYKMLYERGLTYIPASKDRSHGTTLVQNALDYQVVRIGESEEMVKPPMLYVFDTCVRTIWEFEHWQYSEWTGKAKERKDPSEKPQDKDDHQMENIGRAFLDEIPFVPMPKKIQQNIQSIPTLDPFQ